MFIKRLLTVVLVVLGLVWVTPLEASEVWVQIDSIIYDPYAEGNMPPPYFVYSNRINSPSHLVHSISQNGGVYGVHNNYAYGEVSVGHIQVEANVSTTMYDGWGWNQAGVSAGWNDTITVMSVGGYTGMPATYSYVVGLRGYLQTGNWAVFGGDRWVMAGSSYWRLTSTFQQNNQTYYNDVHWGTLDPAFGPMGDTFGIFTLQFPITLGTPLDFGLSITASADTLTSNYFGPGFADTNLMDSVTWGGIQSVTVNGQPIEFSVTSVSGYDYSKPDPAFSAVPIPSTFWLLIGGLPAIIWRLRRARH